MDSQKILKKYTAQLLRKDNVVMVGIGNKITNGKDTGKLAIVVGVKKKLPLESLSAQDVVPKQVKGLDTDIQEVGEIRLL